MVDHIGEFMITDAGIRVPGPGCWVRPDSGLKKIRHWKTRAGFW